jgi:hypothetical protein
VIATPAVDFSRLEEVLIVTSVPAEKAEDGAKKKAP